MNRRSSASLLALLAFLLGIDAAFGQEPSSGWRRFTDKDGHEIDARVMALASDLRTVRIQRSDGRSFDLAITRLSLDDQQYLREWFLSQSPADPAALRFNIEVTRQDRSLSKEKLASPVRDAIWETDELSYEVKVTNLSRVPLANLRLEYCLLMEDLIEVREPDSLGGADEETPRWKALRDGRLRYLNRTINLPPLAYNRSHDVETAPLVRDVIKTSRFDRGTSEDRPIGLIVRLIDAAGNRLAEWTDLSRDYASLDWEAISHRRDPNETDGSGSLIKAVVSN